MHNYVKDHSKKGLYYFTIALLYADFLKITIISIEIIYYLS
jgi:hypothetical protein